MKTFDEIKEGCTKRLKEEIKRLEKEIINTEDQDVKRTIMMSIESRKIKLNNIDEYTAYYIGSKANNILFYLKEYYNNSQQLLDIDEGAEQMLEDDLEYCIRLACSEASELGITAETFNNYFINKDPNKKEDCDEFIQMVNNNYGTNIPLTGELEKAEKSLRKATPEEYNRKLVEFYKMQLRAGCPNKYFNNHSTNEQYLSEKDLINNKTK